MASRFVGQRHEDSSFVGMDFDILCVAVIHDGILRCRLESRDLIRSDIDVSKSRCSPPIVLKTLNPD